MVNRKLMVGATSTFLVLLIGLFSLKNIHSTQDGFIKKIELPSSHITSLKESQSTKRHVRMDGVNMAHSADSSVHRDSLISTDTISIIGVGDIMLGTNYPSISYLPPGDGNWLLKPLENILKDADVTFGNLEGTFLNSGGIVKTCSNPKLCYAFRMPERYVKHLVSCGFDVMSIANNHCGDFGMAGRNNTIKVLNQANIYCAGLLIQPFITFTKNNLKYGFAAFAPNIGTVDIRKIENAKKIIQRLDSISDIVIISFHGGAEGSKHQHVTRKQENYYGENRGNVYEFAHAAIDAGADIIFGHGPHVTRAIEIYKDRFIAYSLGNFCTYKRFNLDGFKGIAPIIKVYTDKKGTFLKGQIIPIIQQGEGGPKVDNFKRAIKKIKELTLTDFPESKIQIDENGFILHPE